MTAQDARRPPKIFIVAGEESGDQLGGALMEALAEVAPGTTFRGVGGRRMGASGLESLYPMDDLTAIGIAAVVGKLPTILRRLRETVEAVLADPPDVLVLVDAPDFTHRVAARVRAHKPNIPIVKYVSPTVWIWRSGRAAAMRPYVDALLALLPFEPEVHRKLGGPPTFYVGHPLLQRLGELRPSPGEAERRQAKPPLVLVLPGSRRREISRIGADFGAALAEVGRVHEMELVLPTLPRLEGLVRETIASWPLKPRIVTSEAEKLAAFRSAHASLAASGTVTLELALAGIPHVAAYRIGWLEAQIGRRVLKGTTVILANLVAGENVVPEFLQEYCTVPALVGALSALLEDSPARRRQEAAFARFDDIFGIAGPSPSARAAEVVLRLARDGRPGALPPPA
ncbi:lipid-A-disaccharide synthase [Xanthobacter flavus]|uniref:Lipid-A-disaccharide synthase n=1 Tax=Xanthobacter flavus TaxID=281 RepID=A0A9W6FIP4_XANFL|nr:lipid-A-disaccharide synthase [Xanthobacter flavus]MDR6332411.1 lipid-A-disaccharide synthase [Xanthobacter flavus]GLI21839.1 lipid-A-disaccharide synthase [Xanthobacter flavus]